MVRCQVPLSYCNIQMNSMVELVALENKESKTVARAMFDQWVSRYGLFRQLLTDQGGEFWGEVVKEEIAKDKTFARVHKSFTAFRKAWATWGNLAYVE